MQTNDTQVLSQNSYSFSLSKGGGTVYFPDTGVYNEIQKISRSGNQIKLTKNGGTITDLDSQYLSLTKSKLDYQISISNGNTVTLNISDGDTAHWKQKNSQSTYSKGSVGIGTVNVDSTALLELKSTNKGVLFPRLTEAQKNAITYPANGLFIYQTDGSAGFYYYTGTMWLKLGTEHNNASNNTLIYTSDGF